MNAEWRALAALALCRYIGGEWSTESFKPLWLGGGTKLKGGTGGAPLVPAARGAAPRTRGETGERRGAINPTFGTGARQGPPPHATRRGDARAGSRRRRRSVSRFKERRSSTI